MMLPFFRLILVFALASNPASGSRAYSGSVSASSVRQMMWQRGIIGRNFHQTGPTNVALGRDPQWRAGLRSPLLCVLRMIFAFVLLVSASLIAQTFRGTILGYSHRCLGRGNFRRQRDGEEREHRPGAQHADQRRRQLQRARVAHRHLYGDHLAEPAFKPR